MFTRTTPDIVPASKAIRLGMAGGQEYAQLDKKGDEYLLEPQAVERADDLAAIEGQRFVSIPVEARDDYGHSMVIGTRLRRALPVARGTYQRELEKAARRAARPQATRRPADALDGLALLRPRADTVWPMATAGIRNLIPAARSQGAYVAGRRKVRGRAMLPALEAAGVTLQVHAGKLYALTAGRVGAVAEVVEKAGRLLLGYLTDQPVRCELDHAEDPPEAITVLVGGLCVCQPHAEGPRHDR